MSLWIWLIIVIDGAILLFGIMGAYQCIKWMRIEKRFYSTLKEFVMTHNDVREIMKYV